MSLCTNVLSRLAAQSQVPLHVSARLMSSPVGGRSASQVGKNNPERRMRVRDFDRGRSSLGHKHKETYSSSPFTGLEKSHFEHDPMFHDVASFTGMMESLTKMGFRRPYKSYTPPRNFDSVFVSTVTGVIPDLAPGSDLSAVKLEGDTKVRVLNALSRALGGHDVPNSMVHTIDSLDKALTFYSTPVNPETSYERMAAAQARGELPPNLHVQLNPLRFDPEVAAAEGRTRLLDTVTAWPRSSAILSTPEARKRYGKGVKAKHSPYVNVPENNKDEEF